MYDAITPINASGITSSTSLTTTTTIHTWCCRPVCKGTDYLLKLLIIILISIWEWKFWVNSVDLDQLDLDAIQGSMLDPWIIPAVYDHHGISKMEINAWSLKNPFSVWPSRDIKDGDQCLIPELSLQCMTITEYQRWRSMLDQWIIPAVYDYHGISKMEINAWSLKIPAVYDHHGISKMEINAWFWG